MVKGDMLSGLTSLCVEYRDEDHCLSLEGLKRLPLKTGGSPSRPRDDRQLAEITVGCLYIVHDSFNVAFPRNRLIRLGFLFMAMGAVDDAAPPHRL